MKRRTLIPVMTAVAALAIAAMAPSAMATHPDFPPASNPAHGNFPEVSNSGLNSGLASDTDPANWAGVTAATDGCTPTPTEPCYFSLGTQYTDAWELWQPGPTLPSEACNQSIDGELYADGRFVVQSVSTSGVGFWCNLTNQPYSLPWEAQICSYSDPGQEIGETTYWLRLPWHMNFGGTVRAGEIYGVFWDAGDAYGSLYVDSRFNGTNSEWIEAAYSTGAALSTDSESACAWPELQ